VSIYKVLVVCAAGMSSSLLEGKAKHAACAKNHELQIHALSVVEMGLFDFACHPVDMVLIAPQVRYKKRSIAEKVGPLGIVVEDIEPMVFGMVDGEKLFEQIQRAVKKE